MTAPFLKIMFTRGRLVTTFALALSGTVVSPAIGASIPGQPDSSAPRPVAAQSMLNPEKSKEDNPLTSCSRPFNQTTIR